MVKITESAYIANNNIWEIAQEKTGEEYLQTGNFKKDFALRNIGDDIYKANRMATMCDDMANSFDDIIDEQNACLNEIELNLEEIDKMQKDLDNKIKAEEDEIDKLLEKRANGSITEEENNELVTKTQNIENLKITTQNNISTKTSNINKTSQQTNQLKRDIATDYGNTAVEFGNNIFNGKKDIVKKIMKAFGKDQEYIDVGENLTASGTNLLNVVKTSYNIDKEITQKSKKLV